MIHMCLSDNHRDRCTYSYYFKMNITSHFQKFRGDSELIEKARPLTVSIPAEIQTGQAYLQVDTLIQDPRKYPVKFPRERGI